MTDPARQDAEAFYYSRHAADSMVYGGLVAAGICALAALSRDLPGLYAGSALGLFITAFHLPMVDDKRPQITADAHGLTIDGLGQVPWSMIRAAQYKETHHRRIVLGQIHLHLAAAPDIALTRRVPNGWLRYLQTRFWHLGGQEIKLDLRALKADPQKVYDTIERYRTAYATASKAGG